MAEKPRLKETDEIFSSIGRGGAKSPPLPVTSQEPEQAPIAEEAAGSLVESLLHQATSQSEPQRKTTGRRRSRRHAEEKEPIRDPRPLDFGKYELPSKEEAVALVAPPKPKKEPEVEAKPPQTAPAPPKMRRINTPAPAVKEEAAKPEPPVAPVVPAAPVIAMASPELPQPSLIPEPQPFVFPVLEERDAAPQIQETFVPQPAPPSVAPEPPKVKEAETPKSEDRFQQLSSRFDQAFNQAFEGKGEETRKGRGYGPRSVAQPLRQTQSSFAPVPEADFQAQQATDVFLQEFQQQVRAEEEVRSELFKDTLAEKFERERERYLKELGIQAPVPRQEEEVSGFQPPVTRRLDLQIDPQMHLQPGDVPKASGMSGRANQGVTYSSSGAVRPLDGKSPAEEVPPAITPQKSQGKRSAEDLLLELGRTNQQGNRPAPRLPVKAPAPKPQVLQFTPVAEPPQQELPKKKPWVRIAVLSGAAVLFVAAFLMVPLLLNRLNAVRPLGGETSPQSDYTQGNKDATIYENRSPLEREEYDNLIIKKANIKVQNFLVRENLLIQNIESTGSIQLEDIEVAGELRLNAAGIETLVLRNVSADRLVINNSSAVVKVELQGQGSIDTIEVRTPASLTRTLAQGADGDSVRQVILRAAPDVGVLDVTLGGMEIRSLTAESGVVVKLGGDTVVERLTGEGSLSVSGDGRVLQMVCQPLDKNEEMALNLGVQVESLSVQGRSRLTVDRMVSSLNASEDTAISGGGEIPAMILSPPTSGHRLQLKLDGVSVHNLIADADATISVTGLGRIMELRANASVYALGNKVNSLYTNASGVIYEVEPDRLVTAAGIRPAGSVADYPNLDYGAGTWDQAGETDTSLDDVSTVCGHSRESGGFLKGDGSVENPYQVATAAQLAHVDQHLESHFYQVADIDLADDPQFASGFPMIGAEGTPFSGSYNGGGYSISNLRISSSQEYVGLFAENAGSLEYVSIRSGEVRSSGKSRCYAGGLVGLNREGGSITASSNGARVSGEANSYLGGICGYNYIAKIRDCYNAAKVSGSSLGGGLVGLNSQGSTLSGSYNVGTMEQGSAIAGQNAAGGVITNCYYLAETAAAGIGSGTGSASVRNTDEMSDPQMVADLSAGRDASPWKSSSGSYTYPLLKTPEPPVVWAEETSTASQANA